MIGQDDIRAAYGRIKPHVRRTPVLRTGGDDFGLTLRHQLVERGLHGIHQADAHRGRLSLSPCQAQSQTGSHSESRAGFLVHLS